jgi:hypothetical protein
LMFFIQIFHLLVYILCAIVRPTSQT